MVIKLALADKKEVKLDAVFPEKIDLVSPNAPDVQVLGQCGVAALHKLNKNGAVGDSATLYQQLGQLYHQHFAHIRLTRRDNLRDNTEINALITTLKKQLDAADTQLAHPDLKNQYKALRDMTDTLLVAEKLRDAAALASSDFPYFAPRPDQVNITNYGMTTLTSAILSYKKAFPNSIPKITNMAHTYFETSGFLDISNTIQPDFCTHHAGVMDIASIPTDTDILVIEPHPNNVTEKAPIAPPSLKTLAQKLCTMSQNRIRPLLVILDITIGVMSDPKLKTKSIASQKIQVVMGQSLVKFGALGIDVASAGLSLVWSQKTAYNTALATLLDEAKPPAHIQAFYAFMLTKGLLLAAHYLDRIRRNTQQLSDHILSELSKSQMGNRDIRIMDLHPNLDRGTCYIGLDFDAFLPQFKDKTSLEKIAREVCNTLQKIASDEGFLLTNRSSFGFLFSNISVCGSAIRLTVGIESPENLKLLGDIVSIVAIGLKWHTQNLCAPKRESPAISQDILDAINSTREKREPALTNRELTKILQKITRISRESKTGFSRELLSIEELCCGEYETEDGFEPNFNWKKTGVGTLSWHPNQDHFEWQFPGRSPQTMAYLEIDPGYAVDASSRIQRSIALLGIENNPTLYDEQQLNGHVPEDMRTSYWTYAFGDRDKPHQVWSQNLLDDDSVIRSIEVDNGTRINGDYFPMTKHLSTMSVDGGNNQKWKAAYSKNGKRSWRTRSISVISNKSVTASSSNYHPNPIPKSIEAKLHILHI